MKRLTERIPDFQEPYRPPGLRECTTVIANSALHNVLELLAAYEDTGLEPNEIEELKERLIVTRTHEFNKEISNNPYSFFNEKLAKELIIAQKIVSLISSENITYREWQDIFSFVKAYIDERRDTGIFKSNH